MSAFDEFEQERLAIDGLLQQGYRVTGITEDLDGAKVTFAPGSPEQSPVELLLLTADARKHVTTLIFAGSKPAAPIETAI
jgi:hypothetical protein